MRKCRKKIKEYVGRGGPPLFAPLPMHEKCNRNLGHSGECRSMIDVDHPEIKYDERLARVGREGM